MVRGGGGGVPSVGHVGQSSVIMDGAGEGYQVSDMWTCGSIKCNYRWRGGGGGTKCRTCGHVGQSSVIIDGAGGVPSVVGQPSVIIDGAGGGGVYQVSDMWTCGSIKCNYRWCGGGEDQVSDMWVNQV